MSRRHVRLIVIASASTAMAESLAGQLRRAGNVVYVTHSAEGCLRVAVSVAPDVVLLDPGLANARRYAQLIKAHPMCAHSGVLQLTDAVPQELFRQQRAPVGAGVTAGPHAA